MPNMELRFIHPIDGRIITADLDGTMRPPDIFAELIRAQLLREGEYVLSKKGGELIRDNATMLNAGIASYDIIRIIPSTSAGGGDSDARSATGGSDSGGGGSGGDSDYTDVRKISRVPAVDSSTIKTFSVEDIRQSAAAVTMIFNLYDELMIKYDKAVDHLEYERSKSRDRLASTVIMFISNLLTAVGVSAYSIDIRISYFMVLCAVALFILSAWVTFRK